MTTTNTHAIDTSTLVPHHQGDLQAFERMSVRFFATAYPAEPQKLISVFHHWIQEQAIGDLLLDVHNYCHVKPGPGVLLVADEAHYRYDEIESGWGLSYLRKRHLRGDFFERANTCLHQALQALLRFEEDTDIRFSKERFRCRWEDRIHVPDHQSQSVNALAQTWLKKHIDQKIYASQTTKNDGPVSWTFGFDRPLDIEALLQSLSHQKPTTLNIL